MTWKPCWAESDRIWEMQNKRTAKSNTLKWLMSPCSQDYQQILPIWHYLPTNLPQNVTDKPNNPESSHGQHSIVSVPVHKIWASERGNEIWLSDWLSDIILSETGDLFFVRINEWAGGGGGQNTLWTEVHKGALSCKSWINCIFSIFASRPPPPPLQSSLSFCFTFLT